MRMNRKQEYVGSEIEEQDNPNGFENDVDQSEDSIFSSEM